MQSIACGVSLTQDSPGGINLRQQINGYLTRAGELKELGSCPTTAVSFSVHRKGDSKVGQSNSQVFPGQNNPKTGHIQLSLFEVTIACA